jgi:Holliday junction resolvase RusA-like endonuclease
MTDPLAFTVYGQAKPAGSKPCTTDDRYRAMEMLGAVGGNTAALRVIVHDGEPASKARARVVKRHAYTPKKTVAAQRALAYRMAGHAYRGNVAVACLFYRSNRQRIDVDNLLKLVLDAATDAGLWKDDSQVTAIVATLGHDPEQPRTIVAFAEHDSSMPRGDNALTQCAACGTLFQASGVASRKHCSRACRMTLAEPVPCRQCGEPFKRRSGNQKYCSNECRGLGARRKPKCENCGVRLSRQGYKLCRGCWLGERNLTNPQAQEIRERYAAGGVLYDQLAAEYSVSMDVIGAVVRGDWYADK